ncbi:molecular chaperone HtpG [bacterium]|nr:molecular chaperone HtpG [bacterium]
MTAVETHEFQAETRQLLDLMVHSVYSEKEIFLRELISNASDALDKVRLQAAQFHDKPLDVSDLHIRLETDSGTRTLTITDNGVGMNKEEAVQLLGTIARSGTKDFLNRLKEKEKSGESADLIGQFGIGFYSSFIVAEEVIVDSLRYDSDEAVLWTSKGDGTFAVAEGSRKERGTTLTLKLRPVDEENGLRDFTTFWTLKEIVKRHSDFIRYPIRMSRAVTAGDPPVTSMQEEVLNSMKALWSRPKEEVTEEEYREFYQHISKDWNEPLETLAIKAEGTFEYESLLFIPSKAPMDMMMQDHRGGLQLFVRRVLISDRCEELLPTYLRFIRGVVDANDLPLNLSRELLQKERQIEQIRKHLTRKVGDALKAMKRDEPEKFQTFWEQFGRLLKEGIYQDAARRDALLEVSLFHSTHGEGWVSLEDYKSRMAEGQDSIYFLTGENLQQLRESPHLEAFTKQGVEVLLFNEPVDEVWLSVVHEFQEKKFLSAAQGQLELGSEEEKKKAQETREQQNKEMATFLSWMGSKLDDVKEVRVSSRLHESPACLVTEENGVSPHFEKLMKAMGQEMPAQPRILEINPDHPFVQKLQSRYDEKQDQDELNTWAHLLYSLALLAEGGELTKPAEFTRQVAQALSKSL